VRLDSRGVAAESDHRRSAGSESTPDQWNDLLLPNGQRSLASFPVGEPTDPLGNSDLPVIQAIGHGQRSSVNLAFCFLS
jgi:hypothetical protein